MQLNFFSGHKLTYPVDVSAFDICTKFNIDWQSHAAENV